MTSPFDRPVTSYMSRELATGGLATPIAQLARDMHARNVSAIPILDEDGALAGVVSRSDLIALGLRHAGLRWTSEALALPARAAREVMTRDPWTIDAAARVCAAAGVMHRHQVHRVFVTDAGRLAGVLSTRDLAAAVRDARVETPLSDVMTQLIVTIDAGAPISAAIDLLGRVLVNGLIVTDGALPIGMFTQVEALASRDLPRSTPVEATYSATVICLPAELALHRAAAHAAQLEVRRIVVCRGREAVGVIGGLDFARVASGAA